VIATALMQNDKVKTYNWPPARPGESIYEFILSNTGSDGEFDASPEDLPGEYRADPQEIRYAPGAKDAIFGSGKPYPAIEARATRIARLMALASKRPSKRALRDLYKALAEDDSIDLADPLLKELRLLDFEKKTLHDIGRWLATTGVDRGPGSPCSSIASETLVATIRHEIQNRRFRVSQTETYLANCESSWTTNCPMSGGHACVPPTIVRSVTETPSRHFEYVESEIVEFGAEVTGPAVHPSSCAHRATEFGALNTVSSPMEVEKYPPS
jgi:hypothetical protein